MTQKIFHIIIKWVGKQTQITLISLKPNNLIIRISRLVNKVTVLHIRIHNIQMNQIIIRVIEQSKIKDKI